MTPALALLCPRNKFSICVIFVCLHPFASPNCTNTVHIALRACWHSVFTSLQNMGQLLLWPSSNLWSSFFRSKASLKTGFLIKCSLGQFPILHEGGRTQKYSYRKKIKFQPGSHSWAYEKMPPLRRMQIPLKNGHLSNSYIWVFSCVVWYVLIAY